MGSNMHALARLAAVGLCMVIGFTAAGRVVDEIIATVDTQPILLSDILIEIGPQADEIRATAASEADYNKAVDELIEKTLDQAIDNRILVREARLAGYNLPDGIVDKRMEEYRGAYDTPEAFQEALGRTGETISDFKARIESQMLAQGMAVQKIRDFEKGVVVSESEVAQYYQDNESEFHHDARVRVYQIFLAAPADPAQREVVRARLQTLKDELNAGAEFKELAIEFSEAPGAEAGGIIGWVNQGDLVGPLNDAAFSLGEGEISDILESDGGLHLLMVETQEPAGTLSLDEARKEIEPKLRTIEANKRFDKWMAELRKRSRVQIFL